MRVRAMRRVAEAAQDARFAVRLLLRQKAFSAARQLADQSLRSVVACKRLMRRNLPLAEVVSRELAELAELRCDPEASGALSAAAAKLRTPER